MRRRLTLALLAVATVAVLLAPTAPASAAGAVRYHRVTLTATVTGSSVRVDTLVTASKKTVAEQYGVCVRTASGANADFRGKATRARLRPAGTRYTAQQSFAPGTYTYFPCARVAHLWHPIGAPKQFTVRGPAKPATRPATPIPEPTPPGSVLFSDDFSGAQGQTFDHSRWTDWSACTYNPTAAYGFVQCGDNETLDGRGHLQIPATPQSGSSISTKDTFGTEYGEFSAWIKMPAQVGYWPAFWTLNNNPDGHDSLPVGEADAAEVYTTWPTLAHRGTHHWNGGQTWGAPHDVACGSTDLSAAFHKYTVRIAPGQISFSLDDVVCGRTERKADGGGLPYAFGPDVTRPNWMILTLAVGGAEGRQLAATQPATMLVDRVEVRSL